MDKRKTQNMKRYCGILVVLSIVSIHVFAQKDKTIVTKDAGTVLGILNKETGIYIYKGVPFAKPPIGDLRWTAPQPAEHWSGVKKCDHFGASAPQGKPVPFSMYTSEFLIPAEPIDEDCLYLNIGTKSLKGRSINPGIVWILGG